MGISFETEKTGLTKNRIGDRKFAKRSISISAENSPFQSCFIQEQIVLLRSNFKTDRHFLSIA
ncbi:hypothetical protein A0128_10515 [Leptospira tipperaryensis]|uniref:Uncharacterized protein n=1 Tax=Leptospira tipperaryensis TaxID=2564040 RepID=A0A1D7UXC5_9LEPT|nr:hypothetical protein A0128_10515 [Leptospira tipperaryensis]